MNTLQLLKRSLTELYRNMKAARKALQVIKGLEEGLYKTMQQSRVLSNMMRIKAAIQAKANKLLGTVSV